MSGRKALFVVSKGGVGDGDPSAFSEWVSIKTGSLGSRPTFRGIDGAFEDLARRLGKALDDPPLERILKFVSRRIREAEHHRHRWGDLEEKQRQVGELSHKERKTLRRYASWKKLLYVRTADLRELTGLSFKELDLRLDFLVELVFIAPVVYLNDEDTSFSWGLENIKMRGRKKRGVWKIQAPLSQHKIGFVVGEWCLSVQMKVDMETEVAVG